MGIQERRARERERRRQQIMVAAKRVFTDKGFGKATMEDIAAEAELSPGTLYLYFKNKDELYASLSLRILQYLMIRLEHVSAEPFTDAKQRLDSLKDAMLDVYEFDPLILLNMFHLQSSETLKNLSADLLQQIETLSRKSMNVIATIFEDGIRKKQFVDRHPTAVADILWSLFSGIVLWETSKKIINGNKDFLRETFDVAFDIFSRGIMRH
jgi:AcrR family transcriptional regulator